MTAALLMTITFCAAVLTTLAEPEAAAQDNAGQLPAFMKDGKLDLEAVVDRFENLHRSDSSRAVA